MLNCYSSTNQKIPVKVGSKVVGYLEGDRFEKQVIGSKHKLRSPPAWAIDAEAFDTQIKPAATDITVIDKETGLEYHCSMQTFDRLKGILDRGFGRQYFLTLSHWKVEENGHKQLSLWGGENNA